MSRLVRPHLASLGVLLVGLALTGVVARLGHDRIWAEAREIMDRRTIVVVEALDTAVRVVMGHTAAAAGLFSVSDQVTREGFAEFVQISGRHPGALGMTYLPVLESTDVTALQAELAGIKSELFVFDQGGERVAYEPRGRFRPVLYYKPGPESGGDLTGFVADTDPVWSEALDRAAIQGTTVVSRVTQLLGIPGQLGFLSVTPILENGETVGFAAAPILIDSLIEGELAGAMADVLIWTVSDVTEGGVAPASPDPLRNSAPISVGGRSWRIDAVPTAAERERLVGYALATRVVLGVLLTALTALAVHLIIGAIRGKREAEELRRQTAEKDEFLAAISHALRTPLTVVVGMSEILSESTAGSESELREYVGMLRDESKQLARLVDDLLLAGRLDEEVLMIKPEVVDLRWEVERLVGSIDRSSRVSVTVSGEGTAWADPARLQHLLSHLYLNALQHGGRNIRVSIREVKDQARVAVTDDGPGLGEEQAAHLFSMSRGSKETAGGPRTLGLGLRIAKRLALALGGDIEYRREEGWTVFDVRLPGKPEAEPKVVDDRHETRIE